MKKTITGWINASDLLLFKKDSHPVYIWPGLSGDGAPVSITYDDGKKATKTVWEWMFECNNLWSLAEGLYTEEEADKLWPTLLHKKLRIFEVEYD